jgi:hypothetical protein
VAARATEATTVVGVFHGPSGPGNQQKAQRNSNKNANLSHHLLPPLICLYKEEPLPFCWLEPFITTFLYIFGREMQATPLQKEG